MSVNYFKTLYKVAASSFPLLLSHRLSICIIQSKQFPSKVFTVVLEFILLVDNQTLKYQLNAEILIRLFRTIRAFTNQTLSDTKDTPLLLGGFKWFNI